MNLDQCKDVATGQQRRHKFWGSVYLIILSWDEPINTLARSGIYTV